jgi:hypothetical protein
MTYRKLPLLAVAAALMVTGAAPSPAHAITETATAGNVTATLSYDKARFGQYANVRETIARGGSTVFDQAAPASPLCPECVPAPALGGRGASVRVLQLDSTPEPEVVFDYFTGGAHCCTYTHVLAFGAGTYAGPIHDWGDAFYELRDLDGNGIPEFDSGDPAFAYAFGAFAAHRFPPQIWNFSGGAFVNVTRQFPAVIQRDASRLRRQLKKFKHRSIFKFVAKPILAAYAADSCLLGDCDAGLAFAAKTAKKAHLRHAGRFRGQLTRFLAKTGYVA